MNRSILLRLCGFAAIAAGPLCVLGGMLHPIDGDHAHSPEALGTDHVLGSSSLLVGTVLLLLSLPGIYGWLSPRLGKLGLVGYVLYFVGNLLNAVPHLVLMAFAGHTLAEHPEVVSDKDMILAAPAFETEQVVTAFGFIFGLLLFGVALVRAHGIPRPIGVAAIAGAVLIFVPIPTMEVVSGLQIELLRGFVISALGYLAVRRPAATAGRDVAPLAASRV
jgi:hypothetical protein